MGSNIKRFEELEIRDDFMFGVIMRNPKYCKPFLETVLNIKIGRSKYPKLLYRRKLDTCCQAMR